MRFVVLHYHIFKNAGSTIENMLDRNFGERFCRLDTADPDGKLSNDVLLSYLRTNSRIEAFSSHHLRHPVPAAQGFLFFDLCFLRDPLDRIRSIYDYLREKPRPGDPVSDLAGKWRLPEFIPRVIETMPFQVNDVQVNLLANAGDYDHPPGQIDFDRAVKRMLETAWLGVVDQFNESIVGGRNLLEPVFPGLVCAVQPVNASRVLDDALQLRLLKFEKACGSRVYDELVRLNALDHELLRRARSEVTRRFNLAPDQEQQLRLLESQLQSVTT
jgi:hypothetical protein